MRRTLVVALVVGLLGGALVGPAEAGKKKKAKKKPPVTFQAEGTLVTSNPGDLNGAGLTRNEFLTTCSMPASQGLDGYVIELSEKISKVEATVRVTGSDATGMHDLDLYFFDDGCAEVGSSSTEAADEVGAMGAGTKYVLVTAFLGGDIAFEFEAEELR